MDFTNGISELAKRASSEPEESNGNEDGEELINPPQKKLKLSGESESLKGIDFKESEEVPKISFLSAVKKFAIPSVSCKSIFLTDQKAAKRN